jgi:hypothetical protein
MTGFDGQATWFRKAAFVPVLALCALLWSLPALAADIVIEFATGDAGVLDAQGSRRLAQKGDALALGDLVQTAEGRVQIRFSDGGIVDLAPQSAFRVDSYRFDGAEDGTERKFMTLVKGLLRTISGAIGHAHQETYRLDTPVASIGIRGTGYTANLSSGLTVEVGEGAVEVSNRAGALQIQRGQAGYVRDALSAPVLTPKVNQLITPDQPQAADDGHKGTARAATTTPASNSGSSNDKGSGTTTGTGTSTGTGTTGTTTPPGKVTGTAGGTSSTLTGQAVFEVGGQNTLPAASDALPGDPLIAAPQQMLADSSPVQSKLDGTIGWSRWLAADGHSPIYTVSATPAVDMPASGTASYSITGGSGPTYSDGHGGVGTASGGMVVTFNGAKSTLGLDLKFAFNDGNTYQMTSTGGLTAPSQSQIQLGINGAFQGSSLGVSGIGSSNACGKSACVGSVSGLLTGTAAERAALAYGIVKLPDAKVDPATGLTTPVLSGVAVLGKTGTKSVTVDAVIKPPGH